MGINFILGNIVNRLMDRFKKNRNMINEEIHETNFKYELLTEKPKPVVKPPEVDLQLVMDLRHAQVDQKRAQR